MNTLAICLVMGVLAYAAGVHYPPARVRLYVWVLWRAARFFAFVFTHDVLTSVLPRGRAHHRVHDWFDAFAEREKADLNLRFDQDN